LSAAGGAWRKRVLLVLCVGVPLGFLGVFALYPLAYQVYGSFFNWPQLKPTTFNGLQNFHFLLANPMTSSAIAHTGVYVGLTVPLEVALGLASAWVTLRRRHGQALLAIVFVIPLVVPWSAAVTLFQGIFESNGTLDWLLIHVFGVQSPEQFFGNPTAAFGIVVAIGVWKGAPWCFLLLLGALAAIPVELLEAARIDGARGFSYWLRIVLPSVRPMLVFVIVFRVLTEAQTFTSVSLLTGGGPYGSTELTSVFGFQLAFQNFEFGLASAMGTLVGATLLVVAFVGVGLIDATPGKATLRALATGIARLRSGAARPRDATQFAPAGSRRQRGAIHQPLPARLRRPFGATMRRWRRVGLALAGVLALVTIAPFVGGLPGGIAFPDYQLPWSAISGALGNSGLVTVATLVGTMLLAIPIAYVLARSRLRFPRTLFLLVLLALAIPGMVLLLPQYLELARMGLINTRLGVVLLYVAADMPLAVFFLRPAFVAVPSELIEAMRVDGATTARIGVRLVLPLAASTLVAVSILVVVQAWNESLVAVTVLNSPNLFTLPVLIAMNLGGIGSLAASWISILPPLLLFIACQRSFRRGLYSGDLL